MPFFFRTIPQPEENFDQAAATNEYLRWTKSIASKNDAAKAMEKLMSMKSYSIPLSSLNKPMDGSLATIIQMIPKEDLSTDGHVLGLMLDSACDGHLENLEFLLGKGLDVDCKLRNDSTALCYAVGEGNLRSIEFLLKRGANVNDLGHELMTPALHAAKMGFVKILQVLLDAGANINAKDSTGKSMLHHAVIGVPNVPKVMIKAHQSRQQVIELLLERGLNINVKDELGLTPLYLAVFQNAFEVVELLLKNGASTEEASNEKATPLFVAVYHKYKDIVKLLLASGADISFQDDTGNNVLHVAMRMQSQDEEIVRILLDNGADCNARNNEGYSPFHMAVEMEAEGIAEIMLNRGANVNLPLDSDTDFNGCTALSLAALYGGQERIGKMLINKGAKLNVQDRVGASPLFFAVTEGYPGMVKMLLDNGAKVYDEVDGVCRGFIAHAAGNGNKEIVALLLQHGAEVNDNMGQGHPPLSFAARGGSKEVMELLLEHGADVTLDTFEALHVATAQGFEESAKVIVKELVRIQSLTSYEIGKRVLDHIKKFDYLEKFMKMCESELEEMEKSFPGTSISYISVLRKGTDDLALVAANENVLNAVESEDLVKVKFPLYGAKIVERVLKGVERKKLLDPVARFFNCLYNGQDKKLPSIMPNCTKKIFEYVDDDDLKSLTEAFETSKKI